VSNKETIRRVLGEFYGGEVPYHSSLLNELASWHCYATDSGHNILIILPMDYDDTSDLTGKLCPAPVKAVLRTGYQIRRGYVVCDLPYSPDVGLLTDPADDEWGFVSEVNNNG
jgi:hypothetical protein